MGLAGLSAETGNTELVGLLPLDVDTPGVVDGSPVTLEVPELDPLDVGEVVWLLDPVLDWLVVPVGLPLKPVILGDEVVVLEV